MSQTDDIISSKGLAQLYSREQCLLASDKSFRLLALSKSRSEDGFIQCSLQSYELADGHHPRYTALSYMWGDFRQPVSILLDGIQVSITSNLLEALEHIKDIQQRHSDISEYWWIDMLCINQADERERGHQVGNMRVYQSANRVVAWLGPDADGSKALMQDLNRQSPTLSSFSLHQTRAFLSRPYWSRLWIIQELCVATDVIFACGTETAPWDAFRDRLEAENSRKSMRSGYAFQNAIGTLSVSDFRLLIPFNIFDLRGKARSQGMSLGSILTFTSQSTSTDPRDRVFAILGLVNQGAGSDIVPDYSLSPCSVFCSAIRAVYKDVGSMHKSKVLGIIARCYHDPLNEDDSIRSQCDGMECDAWWCCSDVALWAMSD